MIEDLMDGLMEDKMMISRTRMGLEIVVRTKGKTIQIISMIKKIKIREEEEEEEGKYLEEEASRENVFTSKKKGIEHLNFPNIRDLVIEEWKARS